MKAVLMAGGRGTRLQSVNSNVPKPMTNVNGMPVLEREIELLRKQGFKNIIITLNYLGDVIKNYFGDGSQISPVTGVSFGVHIEYYYEDRPLGNAGALFLLRDRLIDEKGEDSFLLLNADLIFDVDLNRMIRYHREKNAEVTLFTHPNSHPYDSGLLITDQNHLVKKWITKEDDRSGYYQNRVNAGIHIMSVKVLDDFVLKNSGEKFPEKIDLDRMLLRPLVNHGMYAYDSPEYVKDMGTPQRYETVCRDLKNGLVSGKNIGNKQKAIFLDRDGTINKYAGFVRTPEEFELLPGVAHAIKSINESGYLCIVVTNQPVIARGEVSFAQLDEIHNKMETLLGREGAYLDAIYFCPHHPDGGFEGEVPELKIACECRKPKPGMLLKAAGDYNIDLGKSFMIGDSRSDMEAGKAAGCKTILLSDVTDTDADADYIFEGLRQAVEKLLK